MSEIGLEKSIEKMRNANVSASFIESFKYFYDLLEHNASPYIFEKDIKPLTKNELVFAKDLYKESENEKDYGDVLDKIVVMKLNGGLGTSMGLDKAKTLLPVMKTEDGTVLTFMDIICKQILNLRERYNASLPFMLLNSFRTEKDTIEFLKKYPEITEKDFYTVIQEKEPKISKETLEPVEYAKDPEMEWCPPGHGQVFNALYESKILDKLLEQGFECLFISNSDNLGAVIDPVIAKYFIESGLECMPEHTEKTKADIKGGHVVKMGDRLILREFSQVAEEDNKYAFDTGRHPYANVNNIWLSIPALKKMLDENKGVVKLPLIQNQKTVNPSDGDSEKVVQLESAMGAIVKMFDKTSVIVVDRSRFLPVKMTSDLMVLKSDRFTLNENYIFEGTDYVYPFIDLDKRYYKLVHDFDSRFAAGIPSLTDTTSLKIKGDWNFGKDVKIKGDAELIADDEEKHNVGDGSTIAKNGIE